LTTARYYTPSGRSIQAKGIEPDVIVEQELPPELQSKASNRMPSEASLRGHLKGETKDGKEGSGSSNYVPKEPEKDAQLQYALKMLRGEPLPPTQRAEAPKTDGSPAAGPGGEARGGAEKGTGGRMRQGGGGKGGGRGSAPTPFLAMRHSGPASRPGRPGPSSRAMGGKWRVPVPWQGSERAQGER